MHRSTQMLAWVAFVAAALVLLASPSSAIGVVSIDYGTEWIKAALVKPGMPFDLVLGRDSKRKVQASVAFKGKVPTDGRLEKMERLLSSDAYAFASRSPLQSYHAAKLLLGQTCRADGKDTPAVEYYRSVLGNHVTQLPGGYESGSTCVIMPSPSTLPTTFWRPEEIVGMQLDHMRELAEETSGELLNIGRSFSSIFDSARNGLDTVITVPIFYTLHERQALLDAALLAGFRPQLISDAAAAATSYAHSRTFAKPERHIFYDAGSGSVRATLVEMGPSTDSTRSGANRVTVLDAAWDRLAGGLAMDLVVRDMLADAFDKANPSEPSVRQNARAMARLLREANKIKHVLSANAAASASIESLANDIDLRTSIDREAFEARMRSDGLIQRFGQPIDELLTRTKTAWSDITSVVLVGGASRVPSVHAELLARGVPQEKLAQNVNADEAAVLGAALAVASTQPQLRMKPVDVVDAHMYAIHAHVQGRDELVFPAGPYVPGTEWNLTLPNVRTDASIELFTPTKERLDAGDAGALQRIRFEGVDRIFGELRALGIDVQTLPTKLNASIRSEPFGTFLARFPLLTIEPPTPLPEALHTFFGVNASAPKNETKPPAPRFIDLFPNSTSLGPVRPLAGLEKAGSFERLRLIVHEARQRALRDTAFNELESSVYRSRDMMQDDALAAARTNDEAQRVLSKADELGTWLSTEADQADAKTIQKRQRELDALVSPISRRMSEAERRPAIVADMRTTLQRARTFVDEAKANLTQALAQKSASKYTAAELDTLDAQIRKDATWLEDGVLAQDKRKLQEEPVLFVSDILARDQKLQDTVKRLSRRRIPKTRPKKSSSTTSASSSTSTSSTTTTPATSSSLTSSTTSAGTSTSSSRPVHDEL